MSNAKEEAIELFENMSREQLVDALKEAGFEVSDGNGKVIFTNE